MKTIHKYTMVDVGMVEEFNLPKPYNFLDCQVQDAKVVFWVEVPTKPIEYKEISFILFGTGWDIPDNAVYLATVQDGRLVYHLYRF